MANTDLEKDEIKELVKENAAMKGIIKRYKYLVHNIDDEVAKFLTHGRHKELQTRRV